MITMQEIMTYFTSSQMTDQLVRLLTELFPDFAEDRQHYLEALNALETELGSDLVRSEQNAIGQQMASVLLFCGMLGLNANLDNYIDPVGRCFLDKDPEVYLRKNTASTLPQFRQAKAVREEFYNTLSQEQRKTYDAVTTYVCHLETAGPLLAHYYGYLLGNTLLPCVVPGYHPDTAITMRYHMLLADYFGLRSLPEI